MVAVRKRVAVPSREAYEAAFETERRNAYPAVDAFEREMGHAVDRERLEAAARVLACPVKPNPPCWQHGRVVYAVARRVIDRHDDILRFVDIGTAKGFSALCMAWAAADARARVRITSIDVLDPARPGYRNSIADLDGPKTLAEYLAPWPEASVVGFWGCPAVEWLRKCQNRIHFAFVDGKHSTEAVAEEARLIAERQKSGDVVLFDDLQMLPVRKAVGAVEGYDMRLIQASRERAYMLATKR